MITWLQTRFQGGYKLIFFLLLIVVIVAFVFTIGQAPGMGRGGDRGEPVEYFGYNLKSRQDVEELTRLAGISYYTNYGRDAGEQLQQYALNRLAYLHTGRDLGLPGPTDGELREFISTRSAFQGPGGEFNPQSYQEYLDSVEAHPRIGTNDMVRVFEEDFIVEKVRELLSGPGYAIPQEVKRRVARRNTEWTIELASLPLDAFEFEIEPEEEDLIAFYQENDFRYEVPPHKSVSYVVFETERFLDEAEAPSEAEMREYFEQNRNDFPPPEDEEAAENNEEETEEAGEPGEVRFEEVADEVEGILKRRAARRLALEAASDFTFSLFEDQVVMGSDEVADKIAEAGLPRHTVEPFPEGGAPANIDFPESLLQEIRRLNEDRFFSDPHEFNGDIAVVLLEEIIPGSVPPFEEVRENVAADYREEEKRRLLAERGNELHEALNESLDGETTFIDAAQERDMETQSFDPFTLQNSPEDLPRPVRNQLGELETGEISRMIQTDERAYFVHVVDRNVPAVDETHEDYVRNLEQSKRFAATVTGQLAIQDIKSRALPQEAQASR